MEHSQKVVQLSVYERTFFSGMSVFYYCSVNGRVEKIIYYQANRVTIIVGDYALIVIYLTVTVLYEQELALSLPFRL